MLRHLGRIPRPLSVLAYGVAALILLAGCAIKHPTANLVHGKVLFAQACGSCHTLSHANTAGHTGPNLDDMFRQDRRDGISRTSIQGLVDYWIRYPNNQGVMPAMLLKGQSAQDVAAYVAAVAARSGADTGALALAGGVTGTTAADGMKVFNGLGGCASCHTLAAAGSHGVVGPNLDQHLKADCASAQSKQTRGATLQQCITNAIIKPYSYIPAGFKAGVMPSNFGQTLTKTEVTALVNFLSTATK